MAKKRYHAIVTGLVQNFLFRIFAKRTANAWGLKGYSKNLDNGRVEIVLEGEESKIKKILDYVKSGSGDTKKIKIDLKEEKLKGEFKNFEIYT
ncbi:MAG: acylphosphatase [Candidatus Aenigmarchaeota archaeon]|nr:acylphosphatase [Candidatus Aenigmarchaeota archaeon]